MRFAYVTSTIAERSDLTHGAIDTEWLLEQQHRLQPALFVDHESAGTQRLREAGVEVFVSPKRGSTLPEGMILAADHVQARLLLQEHRQMPFGFVVYSSGMTTDLAWYERALSGIPRGLTLGEGLVPDQRLASSDSSLFQHFGRMMWSGTGFMTGADFLVSDVPSSAFGFKDGALPARFSTGSLDGIGESRPPAETPQLIAVVATTEDHLGLGQIVGRVADDVPIDESTTIVVIHRTLPVGPETTRSLLLGSVPKHLQQSTILLTPGEDGAADSFLRTADFVVAAGPADLAIRSVAEVAARTGFLLLRGEIPDGAPELDIMPAKQQHSRGVVLVPVTGTPADLTGTLDTLMTANDTGTIVLHGPDFAEEARKFIGFPGLAGIDLGILAAPDPVYGVPNPYEPCMHVLGVGRGAWPSIRRRLNVASSLFELVLWSLNLNLCEYARLLVLPGSGAGTTALPTEHVPGLPSWVTENGAMQRPALAGITSVQAAPEQQQQAIREWAASRTWSDRARLALPWRSGLLDRAMRDRW